MDDPSTDYVLVERKRFERLLAAAWLARDDGEFFPSGLEPGDLDDIPASQVVAPPAPSTD